MSKKERLHICAHNSVRQKFSCHDHAGHFAARPQRTLSNFGGLYLAFYCTVFAETLQKHYLGSRASIERIYRKMIFFCNSAFKFFHKQTRFQVDMWAVGVITYILMSGIMPFDDDCRSRLYTHIITANYVYYPQVCKT